jgi:hypothetical protein
VGVHGKGSEFNDEEDLDAIETTGSGLALGQTRLAANVVEREKGGGDVVLQAGAPG